MISYINGKFVPNEKSNIPIYDRGFLIGDGIFETIPVYGGKTFKLIEHLGRLRMGAEILSIPFEMSDEEILQSINQLITLNGINNKDAIIRITLTRGVTKRGITIPISVNPMLIITIAKWDRKVTKPIKLTVSKIVRNESSPTTTIKSINFLDAIIAKKNAVENGFDDAVFLNSKGNLTEATTSNLFIILDEEIHTPPIIDGVLSGITREIIIKLSKNIPIQMHKKSISLDTALSSNGMFLTNSVVGIQKISSFENRKFSDNQIITQLISEFSALINSQY